MKAKRSDKAISQGFESNIAALNTAISPSDMLSKIYQVRYTPNAIEIMILKREKTAPAIEQEKEKMRGI